MTEHRAELSFERFPFFVGTRPPADMLDLPATLPLELTIDPRMAIPRLNVSDAVRAALDKAYGMGSMLSTPLGHGSAPARARLMETVEGLLEVAGNDVSGRRLLEVGCGTGELMAELRLAGARPVGCELGPQGREATERFGIPVIEGELSPDSLNEPVDGIYSYGCLEHIIELDRFLDTCRTLLADGGLFFHSVPNFDLCLRRYRTEDLCHQHANYFTPVNGPRLLAARGFRNVGARQNRAGNAIQLYGRYDASLPLSWPGEDASIVRAEREMLERFATGYHAHLAGLGRRLRALLARGEGIGFYAGGFSLATILDLEGDVRFYDGDPTKHGRCWLASQSPIRAPASLVDDPVDHLVICAEHYFEEIHRALFDEIGIPASVQLHRMSDFTQSERTA